MNHETLSEQGTVECLIRPIAWLHDQPERYDVIHDEVKELWLRAKPNRLSITQYPYIDENSANR